MPELATVRARDCACPGTPHADGDEVYLLPTLPLEGGVTAEQQLFEVQDIKDEDERGRRLTALWLRTFVTHGAVGWNLVDEDGDAVPFRVETILADWTLGRNVSNEASNLYAKSVMAPFQTKPARPSPNGRTPGSPARRSRTTSRPLEPTP